MSVEIGDGSSRSDQPTAPRGDDRAVLADLYTDDDQQATESFPGDNLHAAPGSPGDDFQPAPDPFPADGFKPAQDPFPGDDFQPAQDPFPADGFQAAPDPFPGDDLQPAPGSYADDDRQAIADLYASYIGCLYDYCQGMLRNPVLAADVVQDTLIAADSNIAEPRGQEWLRTWLYAVAHRLCLRKLPHRAESTTLDEFIAEQADPADADTADFEIADLEAFAREREAQLMVAAAVDGLADRDREVLNLYYRHDIAGPDLASVLDVPPEQVRDLVTGAGKRFVAAAATVVVLHANWGWASCPELAAMVQAEDPLPPPLTPQFRKRLARHLNSCDDCADFRGERGFGPAMVAAIPPELPSPGLWDRIVMGVFDFDPEYAQEPAPDQQAGGGPPRRTHRAETRMRALWPMAAAAALVIVLGGGVAFKLADKSSPGPQHADAAAVAQSPASVQPSPTAESTGPVTGSGSRKRPAKILPSLFPAPIGVLPVPSPHNSGGGPPSSKPTPRPTKPGTTHHPKPPPKQSPSPFPSGSPSPTPTPTSPTPTPTSPTPTPTSPSPTGS